MNSNIILKRVWCIFWMQVIHSTQFITKTKKNWRKRIFLLFSKTVVLWNLYLDLYLAFSIRNSPEFFHQYYWKRIHTHSSYLSSKAPKLKTDERKNKWKILRFNDQINQFTNKSVFWNVALKSKAFSSLLFFLYFYFFSGLDNWKCDTIWWETHGMKNDTWKWQQK